MAALQKYINMEKNYNKWVFVTFAAAVMLKLALMGLFSSDYQDRMFLPFIEVFLRGEMDPYDYYYKNRLLSSFPYPPFMLLIESAGGILMKCFRPKSVFMRNLLFKIPLLLFDVAGFVTMKKICNGKIKYIFLLYFLSPVVLFSVYMHGQLDIIPTVLLLIAVYFLIRNEKKSDPIWFSLFLAFSVETKFHILAVVPILFMYLYKKRGLLVSVLCGCLSGFVAIAVTAPFLCKEGF